MVIVADGQQAQAVEGAGEENGDQHEAERCPEGVARDETEPLVGELGRDGEDGFGPEPGGEHAGEAHVEREGPTGDHEVFGVLHAQRGVQAEGHRGQHVEHDAENEHGKGWKWGRWGRAL